MHEDTGESKMRIQENKKSLDKGGILFIIKL